MKYIRRNSIKKHKSGNLFRDWILCSWRVILAGNSINQNRQILNSTVVRIFRIEWYFLNLATPKNSHDWNVKRILASFHANIHRRTLTTCIRRPYSRWSALTIQLFDHKTIQLFKTTIISDTPTHSSTPSIKCWFTDKYHMMVGQANIFCFARYLKVSFAQNHMNRYDTKKQNGD